MTQVLIDCRNISKAYQDADQTIQVLSDLSFSLHAGQWVSVMGTSGCGKSTFLNIVGGLDRPSSGEVLWLGQSIQGLSDTDLSRLRNKEIGFVYQMHHLLMEFSAIENVMMPLLIAGKRFAEARELAAQLLGHVGLSHRINHRPSQLSGGERQRVAIARGLVNKPSCVLMDEPTGNLDKSTAAQVIELMMDLKRSLNLAFIMVTHDHGLAEKADVHYVLDGGSLKQGAHSV